MTDMEDVVLLHHKAALMRLQDTIRSYYEGDIKRSMDSLEDVYVQLNSMRYALFQSTHRSGERG
jgi:hypothetical protein